MKINAYSLKSAAVAAIGGLLFGFDTAVISGATNDLTATYHLTPMLLGVTVASALLGTVAGAVLSGIPGERFGSRDCLRGLAVLYLISALGSAGAWSWSAFLIFRVIGGIAIGGSSVLGPIYIAEIAPPKWRGGLVGFFQLNVVAGILIAYFSNYVIGAAQVGVSEWRWMVGVAALPAAIFFGMLLGIPHSPRWLARKNRIDEAREVLMLTGEEQFETELQAIIASIQTEDLYQKDRLFARKNLFPIFLVISIGMFNQLSGINAILYYLNSIFTTAGYGALSASLQAIVVGFTLLIFTLVGMFAIDRLGRKTLLLIGSVGTCFCLTGIGLILVSHKYPSLLVWLLISFIAFFAFSQGAVIWVYISEVFPNSLRTKGQSLGSFSHWSMNAFVSMLFPVIAAMSGAYPFFFFASMMVLQFFVVLFIYPETKGLSLEEVTQNLGHSRFRRRKLTIA
jgi:sugar porter (SP) family MFS transporter